MGRIANLIIVVALYTLGCGNGSQSRTLVRGEADRQGAILVKDAKLPVDFQIEPRNLIISPPHNTLLKNQWVKAVTTDGKRPAASQADFTYQWNDHRFQEVNAFFVASEVATYFRPLMEDLQLPMPKDLKIQLSDLPFPSNSYSCFDNTMALSTGSNPPISASVVAHEYGHALHGQAGGCESLQDFDGIVISESYADFFSVAYTNDYEVGGYRYFELSNDLSKRARFPQDQITIAEYLHKLSNPNLDVWQAYPNGFKPVIDGLKSIVQRKGYILEPHVSGKILTTTLLEIARRTNFKIASKLVLQGLALAPSQTSYLDSMNALLKADRAIFKGQYRDDIEHSFKDSGIFVSTLVTVLDNDFDFNHQAFSNNRWVNTKERSDGQDNDGNGYIDDIHGYDLESKTGDTTKIGDDCGHGTMIADIIGNSSNQIRLNGVRFSFDFFKRFFTTERQKAAQDLEDGVGVALGHGARVLNFSGGMSSAECRELAANLFTNLEEEQRDLLCLKTMSTWTQMFQNLVTRHKEVLFVFAAGNRGVDNDNSPTYPCNIEAPNVLCVGNIKDPTEAGEVQLKDSNWGEKSVDLAAVGYTPKAACGGTQSDYGSVGKSSAATAYVTRAAANALTVNYTLSAPEIKMLITKTVSKYSALATKLQTGGVLDSERVSRAAALTVPLGNNIDAVLEKVIGEGD